MTDFETLGELIPSSDTAELERTAFQVAEGDYSRPVPDQDPLSLGHIMGENRGDQTSILPGYTYVPEGHACYLD